MQRKDLEYPSGNEKCQAGSQLDAGSDWRPRKDEENVRWTVC
ncbi:hypothetical protein N9018_02330 [Rhodopirellula sp.]|mgnify:CR=1 FL=1|nr:hypothetical protein [Rhodopirellula sp.]